MKKIYFFLGISILLTLALGVFAFPSAPAPITHTSPPPPPVATTTPKILEATPLGFSSIALSVGSTTYRASVPAHTTVLNAMRILASTTAFTFTGREYPSLGFFVESIDGTPHANGYEWFLYVDGKESSTGASHTTLNDGDRVEWRYKK